MTQPPQDPSGNRQPSQRQQPYQFPQAGYGPPTQQTPQGYPQQTQPQNQYPQVGYFGGQPGPKKKIPWWVWLVAILVPLVIISAVITALNPKTETDKANTQPTKLQAVNTTSSTNTKPTATVKSATPVPAVTTAQNSSANAAASVQVAGNSSFNSSGLGQSKADWEKAQGQPENVGGTDWYQSKTLQPIFQDDKVWNLQKVFRVKPPTIEVARVEAKAFSPKDAQPIKTYTAPNGSTVDLFLSQSLKDRFPSEKWTGGEPGNFIVIYHLDINSPKQVTSFTIAPGNNP
jgi:hypothetical protein